MFFFLCISGVIYSPWPSKTNFTRFQAPSNFSEAIRHVCGSVNETDGMRSGGKIRVGVPVDVV